MDFTVPAVLSINFQRSAVNSQAISFSEDSRVAVVSEDGVHVIELYLSQSKVAHRWSFLANLEKSYSLNVEIATYELLSSFSPGFDYDRIVFDKNLVPEQLPVEPCNSVKLARWSPAGIANRGRCMLAVLSHVGYVSVYESAEKTGCWNMVVNLTDMHLGVVREQGYHEVDSMSHLDYGTKNDTLKRLINRNYALSAVSMVWSDLYCETGSTAPPNHEIPKLPRAEPQPLTYCHLFVLMKSGHIVIWRINSPCGGSADCHLLSTIATGLSFPRNLCWCPLSHDKGLLAVGDLRGSVTCHALNVQMPGPEISVCGNPKMLWMETDHLEVNNMAWSPQDKLLLVGKERFLVAFSLEVNDGEIISTANVLETTNSFQFSTIAQAHGGLVATSGDGHIYHISQEEGCLSCRPQSLAKTPKNVAGIAFSANHVLYAYVQNFKESIQETRIKSTKMVPKSTLYICQAVDLATSCQAFVQENQRLKTDCLLNISLLSAPKPDNSFENSSSEEKFSNSDNTKTKPEDSSSSNNTCDQLGSSTAPPSGSTVDTLSSTELCTCSLARLQLDCWLRRCSVESVEAVNRLEEELLRRRFMENVELLRLAQPSELLPLSKWLETKSSSEWICVKEAVSATKSLEKEEELCAICNESLAFTGIKQASCKNGHTMYRCCQSLSLCYGTKDKYCMNCHSRALYTSGGSPWLQEMLSWRCVFCDGVMS